MTPDEISLVSYMSLLFKCYRRILCMRVKALKMTSAQTANLSLCLYTVPLFVYSYFEKGVRKSHTTVPKGGWFWVHSSSKKFERMAWEAMGLQVRLRMLKESNKSRFDSFSVRDSASIIIIPYYLLRLLRAIFFEIVCINGISRALASISTSSRSNCWI